MDPQVSSAIVTKGKGNNVKIPCDATWGHLCSLCCKRQHDGGSLLPAHLAGSLTWDFLDPRTTTGITVGTTPSIPTADEKDSCFQKAHSNVCLWWFDG